MADLTSVRAKIADALNEADAALGQPTDAQTIADLTAQLAAANAANAALQGKLDAVRVKAQALKDRDNASVDGQDILDVVA